MKFDNNLYRGLIFKQFAVQKGMYFNNSIFEDYGSFYFSDNITDEYWNLFIPENTYLILKEFDNIIKVINQKEKEGYNVAICVPSFIDNFDILCEEIEDKKYNYKLLGEETWMIVDENIEYIEKTGIICKLVETDEEFEDYLNVFKNAYGGDKTEVSPYGTLDKAYMECIINNKYNNYIRKYVLYADNKPVSCATMNLISGIGGLYDLGTVPEARGNGYGTIINSFIVNDYFKSNSKFLFFQTERGSSVEKWYKKLNYKEAFYLRIYGKDSENNE